MKPSIAAAETTTCLTSAVRRRHVSSGKYGRMRLRYLWEHHPVLLNQFLLSGKLMTHLRSIDEGCQVRLNLLIPQMTTAESVAGKLKNQQV